MSTLVFDTLKLADALRAADFSETQAKGLVAALTDSTQDTLATKADVATLRTDIDILRSEIGNLRSYLHLEIATLRCDFQSEIKALRSELRSELATLRVDTAKWIIGAVAFNFLATAGLFATLFKLFAK